MGLCLTLCSLGHSPTAFAEPSDDATAPAGSNPAEESSAPVNGSDANPAPAANAAAQVPTAPPYPNLAPSPVLPNESGVDVEVLPGSSYPEDHIRGLVGSSLWLTIPGAQWPYLPKLPGKSPIRLGISGSAWVDTSYARITSGTPDTIANLKRWANQGRAVLRATPTYSLDNGWFAQGQVEVVANGDQNVPSSGNLGGIDDLYVRAGKWKVFDITAGRFQGWEIYHYGMGLDLNTLERRGAENENTHKPPQIYGVDYFWDRPNGGAGDYAAHVYLTDYLRLEGLAQIGTSSGANLIAARWAAILDLGYFKAKVGSEYGKATDQKEGASKQDVTKHNGFGGSLQFVANPYIEGGINGAIGYIDSINGQGLPDLAGSTTTKSVGGFLNGRVIPSLLVGVGADYTYVNTLLQNSTAGSAGYGKSDIPTHFQAFFAVQYGLWDRVFIKFVGSRASFHYEDNLQTPSHSFTNGMWGGRLRLMYLF